MRLLVTFGPTYEPLDEVRRLTNFSTGRLGSELVNYFVRAGHRVTALRGSSATFQTAPGAEEVREFTTTDSLLESLRDYSQRQFDAIFHAAAVSDFRFGTIFERGASGELIASNAAKFCTRSGALLAELVPTPKVISSLRALFGAARIFGWKYAVDGSREAALQAALLQIRENNSDFCVVNGRAYGDGFGITASAGLIEHAPDVATLAKALLRLVSGP